MVQLGYGLTNLVERATARADESSIHGLKEGARRLEEKVRRYRPRYVAMAGISTYRVAFTTPKAMNDEANLNIRQTDPEAALGCRHWTRKGRPTSA